MLKIEKNNHSAKSNKNVSTVNRKNFFRFVFRSLYLIFAKIFTKNTYKNSGFLQCSSFSRQKTESQPTVK